MNEYCLPVEDVVRLNHQLIGRDGNLLDRSKLESALATPLQTFGGEYWHPSALDRAAALLHYLAKAHAFVDGNKRIAWVCASTYLEIEGFGLGPIADEEIVELVETVAAARDKKEGFIAEWFADRLI